MSTKIKTTKRKAWHRATDRWEWRSAYVWHSSPNDPKWSVYTGWTAAREQMHERVSVQSPRAVSIIRDSLRRITP